MSEQTRSGPDGFDCFDCFVCFGQTLEAVADQHEYVADAAVLYLGQDGRPVLGTFAAVAGPQAEDVPPALGRDGQGHTDRQAWARPTDSSTSWSAGPLVG
ncbi:hypothetical protein ABIC27_005775 [Streptomyces sp. PvR034]